MDQQISLPRDRRDFLRLTGLLFGGALLSGCGDDLDAVAAPEDAAATTASAGMTAPATTAGAGQAAAGAKLNLALNLAYIGAQYYGVAARGVGLPAAATAGVGTPGSAVGARRVAFADPELARYAGELADDKHAHVLALRAQLGALSAAQPAIDLSATSSTGAFAEIGGAGGLGGFDPYAGDTPFLIGASLVEDRVAAAYRGLLDDGIDDAARQVVTSNLAQSIYHGGLVRTLLDARAAIDPAAERAPAAIAALLAGYDGASGSGADILDADGREIPFSRSPAEILQTLAMSPRGTGGFLPLGANGVQP